MVKKSLSVGGHAMLVVAAATSLVFAQQTRPEIRPGQPGFNQATNPNIERTGPAGMRHDVGHFMIECLIHGNQAEITLARIAERRASDPEVKKFAERMIKEHTEFLQKLETAQSGNREVAGANSRVGRPGVDVNVPGARVQVQPREAANPNAPVERSARFRGQMGGGAWQFINIMKEVEAQCLQSAIQELSHKEGAQFDRCYMNGMVMAHMRLADELKVFMANETADMRPVLQEGLKVTKQHLAMAKQIADRLDSGNRTTARDRSTLGQ